MINREFYAYSSDELPQAEFEDRFETFQGQNNNVRARYVSSDFIRSSPNEMATLQSIFVTEEQTNVSFSSMTIDDGAVDSEPTSFNVVVDLCGIFKRSSIQDVCSCIREHYGPDRFHYLYHIDQSDNSDRVLCIKTGNDVQYDEEFYKHLCKTYGADLRNHIFFFVDNRNVIGKDIPFQLVYQRQFDRGLFMKSIVIAHDVDDFSKIWQAMGRSRTMNQTYFTIYKSDIPDGMNEGGSTHNIRKSELTRLLYVTNCDRKMAGNISSIYLTLIALFNLSQQSFYYKDTIINTFLEKMEMKISKSVSVLEEGLALNVLGKPVLSHILQNILADKLSKSPNKTVFEYRNRLAEDVLEKVLRQIVNQKFEQRVPSGDIFDQITLLLSGEQQSLMEVSYTKQQQKQKQRQQNKNQDSDAMGIFNERHQLSLTFSTSDYFVGTFNAKKDRTKQILNQPIPVPILSVEYTVGTSRGTINVYPTLQFLYSHHIHQAYITDEVKKVALDSKNANAKEAFEKFLEKAQKNYEASESTRSTQGPDATQGHKSQVDVTTNFVQQAPQYTIAALRQGVYVIGMKNQFNVHDLETNVMRKRIQYVMDEMGFVLFDRTDKRDIDAFGPYFIEQYILMDVLSKQEVAQNVLDYYCRHKETIQRGLEGYDEKQGKGFVCWRFLINETAKAMNKASKPEVDDGMEMNEDDIDSLPSAMKRRRSESPDTGI